MARKSTKPPAPPKFTRAQKKVFADAVKEAGDALALRRGDSAAILSAARRRADDEIDRLAAKAPTSKRRQMISYAKKGVRIE